LGDRAENLASARERLNTAGIRIVRESSIYETAAREVVDQPMFLNQVVEAETDLFPRQLLARVGQIEREMGRKRTIAKGPRMIDIDILLFGNFVVTTPELEIPHPRMMERRFVLEPLAELVPNLRHPVTKMSVREMLAKVGDQQVRMFEAR
jgi:2-amino-4-hydroxy-6-hydroxymethyldihydropteridine diphosphokinase